LSPLSDPSSDSVTLGDTDPTKTSVTAIRCVCGSQATELDIVKCVHCLYVLHAKCVLSSLENIQQHSFICPFCMKAVEEELVDVSIEEQPLKPRPPDSPIKRKYNLISEYIHGSDSAELLKKFIKSNEKPVQLEPNPLTNFEFCDIVQIPASTIPLLKKKCEVREIRGRGHKRPVKFGVFINETVDPGVFIDMFVGHFHLMSNLIEKAGQKLLQSCSQPFVLVPHIPEGLVVDARRSGNEMRFIRRSCRPNVTIKPIICDAALSVGIFAMNGLREGDELFAPLDGLPLFKYECSCGTPDLCLAPIDLMPEVKSKDTDIYELPHERSLSVSEKAQTSQLTQPKDIKKLSREERKLQRYIEFFEKMDAIDSKQQQKGSRKKQVRPAEMTSLKQGRVPSSPKHLKKQWLTSHQFMIAAPVPMTPLDNGASDHLIDVVSVSTGSNSSSAVQHQKPYIPDDSRMTPLSQIISAEGTAIPGDGETPTRKRLSLNDYLERRRKATSPLSLLGVGADDVTDATPQEPKDQEDEAEEGQIVE
jgi:hypothetical protein